MRCLILPLFFLAGCSTVPSVVNKGPSALVIASCPKLTPLADDSFGATVDKLAEVAGQYYTCREAALAGKKD